MEKVKDLILYQVATDRNYKVGDKIYFGKTLNGQMKIFDFSFNRQGKPLHELGFKTANKGIFKNKQLQLDMAIALQNYDLFMREIALEEVRQEKFPELPSRFRCMYLSESKEDVFKNIDIMASKSLNKTYQAVAVKLNGEIFCVRDFSIGRPGLSFNEYKKLAEKYWSQDQNSTTKAKEILFVGKAEIVEILKEEKSCKKSGYNHQPADNTDNEYWGLMCARGSNASVNIIDNLLSDNVSYVLSANQGRILKGLLDEHSAMLSTINSTLQSLSSSIQSLETKLNNMLNGVQTFNKVSAQEVETQQLTTPTMTANSSDVNLSGSTIISGTATVTGTLVV